MHGVHVVYSNWKQVVNHMRGRQGRILCTHDYVSQITFHSLRKYVPVKDNTCNLSRPGAEALNERISWPGLSVWLAACSSVALGWINIPVA